MIKGDYHTHTVFSHGKGSIEDNVRSAERAGLSEIAITDHGLRHVVFGLNPKKVRRMRAIIEELQKTTDVKILLGVEANLISSKGEIDIKPNQRDWFDVVVVGFHKASWSTGIIEWFRFTFINDILALLHLKAPERIKRRNTKALCDAVRKNDVDVLSHVNFDMEVYADEVARACKETDTYFEISSRKEHLSLEEWKKVLDTGVNFVIDSDAHTPEKIGDYSLAERIVEEVGIPRDRIANENGVIKKKREI